MRKLSLCALALLLALSATGNESPTKLNGEYYWDHARMTGDLEVVFEPTGERSWDVAFYFTFDGKPRIYKGTAAGSLESGPLEGKVTDENGRRRFTFEGAFEDGVFEGTHAELRRGRESRMGTLTLSRR